ncbi:hypothetical protein FHR99_001825 [Litorivivens lipolytica]|uniref:Outer membrane protein TolC n=1 Tax=Litorivivens lipolytica TaxID=1524264 RepID=A0A7W4W531_9GAMM|nr:TolC family protein [Litorivivens lipolytica]MBB3047559.1 hypothetical protein [Litorivivens lipolytica]
MNSKQPKKTQPGMAKAQPRKRRLVAAITALSVTLTPMTAFAQEAVSDASADAAIQNQTLSEPAQQWLNFISQLRHLSQQSYRTNAEELELRAREAALASERGDLGLNLTASYAEYPDGLGGNINNGTGTDDSLEQYSDVRLNYRLLDQLLRKGSRVDAAKARLRQAEYRVSEQNGQAATELARGSAIAWAEKHQYHALSQALDAIQAAKKKLKLSAEASMPEITEATLANEAEALILHNEITSAFDSLSPFEPSAPRPPMDYTVLPQRAPGSDDIVRLANNAPQAKILELEAEALQEDAESYRGNGINLDLYAGQVFQSRGVNGSDREDGPQMGAVLTIPLGASDYYEGKALRYQAEARRREAADALLERQRELIDLRNQWSQSVAALSRATERMRQQSRILEQMRTRASQPGSGRAPHPWQIDVETARFWLRVADTWRERGEWLANVLTWAVNEPDYLAGNFRESNLASENAICAPLYEC